MTERLDKYAEKQKKFWNVETVKAAMFERIDTEQDKSEESWHKLAEQDSRRVIDGIQIEPHFTLLEVGCGIGRVIDKLRERVKFQKYIGVDISEKMVQFAREYLGEDERISLIVNNGYDLAGVSDNVADFAYSVDVFIHIYDFDIAASYLNEVCRALKPGGRFRFNVRRWNVDTAFGSSLGGKVAKLSYKLGLRSAGAHAWQPGEAAEFNGNQYTTDDLRKLISQSRFNIIKLEDHSSVTWCTLEK